MKYCLFIPLLLLSCVQKKLSGNKGYQNFIENLPNYSVELSDEKVLLLVLSKSECELCEQKITELVHTNFRTKTYLFSNDKANKYNALFIANKDLAKFNLLSAEGFIFILNKQKISYAKNIDTGHINDQINELLQVLH